MDVYVPVISKDLHLIEKVACVARGKMAIPRLRLKKDTR